MEPVFMWQRHALDQSTTLRLETVTIVVVIYRQTAGWKVRAVGQGYAVSRNRWERW
jgi:stress response protein SCP2